ncbi:MAG: 16S rRNA (guanine(527)-N(7))-methyltransferase RsmG [Christensenellales bacterium]
MIEKLLKEGLLSKGVMLSAKEADAFETYDRLLREWNDKINLTSIKSEEETVQKHYIDSLAPIWLNLLPEKGILADIGAGAGFPSIPICIMRPQLQGVFIESIGKKCVFLQTAITALGLNASVKNGRAEELGKKELFRKCDIVVARAVGPLSTLISYAVPMLSAKGHALFYKGPAVIDEMQEGRLSAQKAGNYMLEQYDSGMAGMQHSIIELKREK